MKTQTKPKVSLTPPTTFRAEVEIRTPGGALAFVSFDFKHRTKSSIKELLASMQPPEPADPKNITEAEAAARAAFVEQEGHELIMDIASGWDLDDEYNIKTVERLTEAYAGSAQSIFNTYLAELSGARLKN